MPVVANLSVFTYLSNGSIIAPPTGTSNFYALNNYSNVIFFDIEDGGSEDSILLANFTPENKNITYTSHWFYMNPIGFIEKVVNNEESPRTFYRYSIQVPPQVLSNNKPNTNIKNELTVIQRFGFNYKGFVDSVEELPNADLETRYNEKETYYVLNEGFYQVIDNAGVYEWADVDDSIDLLSMVKQYSVGEIYVQKGYSNPLGVAPVTVTNTEYIMSILAQMQIKYNTVDEALDNHVDDLNNPHKVKAFQIPFNNSGTDLVSTIVENVIKEINTKANINTQDILDMINGDKKFNIVAYDVNFSGELEVGQTKWNDTFKCLETRLSDNVVIQHGQENLQYVRASTNILETNAVYFTGSTGQRMNVGIASNTDKVKARGTIAIATETFTTQGAEQFGFVCTYGLVNGVKTDYAGWVTGQTLWLGANGALTNVMPTGTAYRTRVGIVGRVHGTDGSIFVNPQFIPTIDDLSQVNFTNPQEHDILVRNADGTFSNSQRLKLVEDEAVRLENDKADKTYVDSEVLDLQQQINSNDLDIQGLQDNKENKSNKAQDFTTINSTLYPSVQATKNELDKKVDKILTIIGLDLQNNISLEEFKTALGNVTQIVSGLMSAEDKTHLDNLVALFNEDGDDIVNTIAEILAVFENFPEGATILEVLATKVDKVAGKQLSTNDLTNTLKTYYDIAYAHSQIVNANPHQTTYSQLLNKPTTIEQSGITNVYNKEYIDALKDKNGWESELLGTLSNNGTIALSVINQYDEIQMYAKDTLGVIDNENIRPSLMQSGDSVYFFDDTQAFIMVDTVFGFYAPVGYTLQVVGLKYTDFTAEEVSTNEVGVTVQDKLDEIDLDLEQKTDKLESRQVGETTIQRNTDGLVTKVESPTVTSTPLYVGGILVSLTETYSDGKTYITTFNRLANGTLVSINKQEVV